MQVFDNDQKISLILNNVENGRLKVEDFDISRAEEELGRAAHQQTLGAGGLGTVTAVGAYAHKENTPCVSGIQQISKKVCDDLRNPVFYKIDGGYTYEEGGERKMKERYILPNLYSETVIGMAMNTMENKDREGKVASIGYAGTVGGYKSGREDNPVFNIIMKRYKPMLEGGKVSLVLDSGKKFIYMMFQVAHALLQGQGMYKLTHYDLHTGNVLYDDYPGMKKYIEYGMPGGGNIIIRKEDCPFIIKIADFGASRMETEKVLVGPTMDNFPEASFGEYDSSYDFMSFMGSILFNGYLSGIINGTSDSYGYWEFMVKFMFDYLGENQDMRDKIAIENIEDAYNYIKNKYYKQYNHVYRPAGQGTLVSYRETMSMAEVVKYLGTVINGMEGVRDMNDKTKENTIEVRSVEYDERTKVKGYLPVNILGGGKLSGGISKYVSYTYEDKMIMGVCNFKTMVLKYEKYPAEYNFSVSKNQREKMPTQEQYITQIKIPKDYDRSKYEFKVPCCKLDPVSYLAAEKIEGCVINGSFFNIGANYEPLGNYGNEVPSEYAKYYGSVIVNDKGLAVDSDELMGIVDPNGNREGLYSAPVLIKNGEIVFDSNKINEEIENLTCMSVNDINRINQTTQNKYRYDTEMGKINLDHEYYGETKYNDCGKISPGELKHAGNSNPRSALAILEDGSVVFITVEGRDMRGMGTDLADLAEIIKVINPTVVSAINLDGGGSSIIAWRTNEDLENVYISNPAHMYHYPVGNLIAFVKK